MSMRGSAFGWMALSVAVGGVLWWGFSRSQQTQTSPLATPPLNEALAFLQNEQNTVDVVQKYGDGVVFVSVRSAPSNSGSPNDPWGFFQPFVEQPRQGTGSGFVLDTEGYILTNHHVVQGASEITVRFHSDTREFPAQVVGTAAPLDIALLKVDAPKDKLMPLVLGDSGQVKVGQKAIAMGNPFGLEFTVTEGIVSAVRSNPGAVGDSSGFVQSVIQTDAAINPGNSGGPLLNSRGEVVGINTSIYSTAGNFGGEAQNSGVGFALPINTAKQYLPDLRSGKTITARELRQSPPRDLPPEVANRPRIGVSIGDLAGYPARVKQRYNLPDRGAMVLSVQENAPAARAGLRAATQTVVLYDSTGQEVELGINGDVILEADGKPIESGSDLTNAIVAAGVGKSMSLKVWREGRTIDLKVVPEIIK
jgi:serine protease Do